MSAIKVIVSCQLSAKMVWN